MMLFFALLPNQHFHIVKWQQKSVSAAIDSAYVNLAYILYRNMGRVFFFTIKLNTRYAYLS